MLLLQFAAIVFKSVRTMDSRLICILAEKDTDALEERNASFPQQHVQRN